MYIMHKDCLSMIS